MRSLSAEEGGGGQPQEGGEGQGEPGTRRDPAAPSTRRYGMASAGHGARHGSPRS